MEYFKDEALKILEANPNNYEVVFTDEWLKNRAVLYKNKTDGEYILTANNPRCFLSTARQLREKDGYIFMDNRFLNIFSAFFNIRETEEHGETVGVKCSPKRVHAAVGGIYIDGKKHPVMLEYKNAGNLADKFRSNFFVIEGERLLRRAIDDGLLINNIVYTKKSPLTEDGYIKKAENDGIPCYMTTEGLLSALTASRPAPSEIALCGFPLYSFEDITVGENLTYLITDNVENPDNLGLIIRTADACGADAVFVTGNGSYASPYHKNCVRASRGAIGRLPVIFAEDSTMLIEKLKKSGFLIYGSTAHTENTLADIPYSVKKAMVVGSETYGMSLEVAEKCDFMFKIPMASGQSSFNVAVAAGIILNHLSYEG